MKRMRHSSPRNQRVPRTARHQPDTVTTTTPTRSALPLHNLQEHLDAGASASRTARVGAAQYFTPQWFADLMAGLCPGLVKSGIDLQSGSGSLLRALSRLGGQAFGIEIDPRANAAADQSGGLNRPLTLIGNCVRFTELWQELFPSLYFSHVAVNPPFSLLFKTTKGNIDSTLWTWEAALRMAGAQGTGFLIANADTIERLQLHNSKQAWLYQRFPSGIFPDAAVEIGVLHFHVVHQSGLVKRVRYSSAEETQVRSEVAVVTAELMARTRTGAACPNSSVYGSDRAKLIAAFDTIRSILAEEARPKSAFNVWLDKRGRLATYLSTYEKFKREIGAKEIARLASLNGAHPLALTPEKETRELLRSLVEDGTYTIDPAATAAIRAALEECKVAAVPIMPVTDFQRVAYADEEEALTALADTRPPRVQHGLTDDRPRRPFYQAEALGLRYLAQANPQGEWHGYVIDLEAEGQPFIGEPICLAHSAQAKAWVEREVGRRQPTLTKGKTYPITTATYDFVNRYERMKLHLGGNVGTYAAKHNLTLSGADRYIQLFDDKGRAFRFMDRPGEPSAVVTELADAHLWQLFESPAVLTVAEQFPEAYQQNLDLLASIEDIAGFRYYDGQRGYLARVATRDGVLIGAETGTGKSLMCITLFQMKGARRGLIVAPQGTTRADEDDEGESAGDMTPSQWIAELRRFAPGISVFELFGPDDYERILALNGGELPPGLYVSYYEAMFSNGAREHLPKGGAFTDARLAKECRMPLPPEETDYVRRNPREWCEGIGEEVGGIRCIARPTLATRIGHLFDFVGLDEAHKAQKLSSQVTQQIIRLQPRYRFAFTATPIPNIATDIFPLMGWINVPRWYEGGMRNAAWPYAREDGGRFSRTFLCTERDLTQEAINREIDPKWRGKCEKVAPTISAPARLLKLLTPGMAYISKLACNPELPPRHVHDVRVPMGAQQARLYAYYMNRANVPGKDAMEKAGKQVAILRDLCAHPATSRWNCLSALTVRSQFNPKAAAILGLVAKIVSAGRQVVIVNARLGQTELLAARLREAGVSFARIDSSLTPDRHTAEANRFKSGEALVMLMGIKCAQAHSFVQCQDLIIGSLEYTFGSFEQAVGRVYRVTTPAAVNIWCVLHQNSIEEIMFDAVATKGDAATICLRGQRVPRDFKPLDLGEILAENFLRFQEGSLSGLPDESATAESWPELARQLQLAAESACTETLAL